MSSNRTNEAPRSVKQEHGSGLPLRDDPGPPRDHPERSLGTGQPEGRTMPENSSSVDAKVEPLKIALKDYVTEKHKKTESAPAKVEGRQEPLRTALGNYMTKTRKTAYRIAVDMGYDYNENKHQTVETALKDFISRKRTDLPEDIRRKLLPMLVAAGITGFDILDIAILSDEEIRQFALASREMQAFCGPEHSDGLSLSEETEGRYFVYKMLTNPYRPRFLLKSYARIFAHPQRSSTLIAMEYQRGIVKNENGAQQIDQDMYVGFILKRHNIITMFLRQKMRFNLKIVQLNVHTPDIRGRLNRSYGTTSEVCTMHSAFTMAAQKCVFWRIDDDTPFQEIEKSIDEYDMDDPETREKIPPYVYDDYLLETPTK
jgi:hypothetical protein